MLKRLARKHLRLPEGRGTGAFDFEVGAGRSSVLVVSVPSIHEQATISWAAHGASRVRNGRSLRAAGAHRLMFSLAGGNCMQKDSLRHVAYAQRKNLASSSTHVDAHLCTAYTLSTHGTAALAVLPNPNPCLSPQG